MDVDMDVIALTQIDNIRYLEICFIFCTREIK